MSDYFAREGINWSTLKAMRDSALHYKHAVEHKREDTPALALGRVTHSLVFEPNTFARDYAIFEGARRAGKEWDAFEQANEGKTIFKPSEVEKAIAMAAAVRSHPLVAPYLAGGTFEEVLTWVDQPTGLLCKAKADWIIPGTRTLIDLKTAQTIDTRRFQGAVARYGYHGQLAHYAAGCEGALGWYPRRVILVAVESAAPFDVGVFELDEEARDAGESERRELLEKVKACREAGKWPGRYESEQSLSLPGWVFGDTDIEFTEEDN